MNKFQIKPQIKSAPVNVRIKVVKAPLVNTEQLRSILFYRSRAVVI